MIASLNQSSSLSGFGSTLMSGATFTTRPPRETAEQQGGIVLLIEASSDIFGRELLRRWSYVFGSEPNDGQIFIAERSRKGSRKLLWSVMPEAPIAADAG